MLAYISIHKTWLSFPNQRVLDVTCFSRRHGYLVPNIFLTPWRQAFTVTTAAPPRMRLRHLPPHTYQVRTFGVVSIWKGVKPLSWRYCAEWWMKTDWKEAFPSTLYLVDRCYGGRNGAGQSLTLISLRAGKISIAQISEFHFCSRTKLRVTYTSNSVIIVPARLTPVILIFMYSF